ncbi:MFS transporter [Mammaliicoccus sciuri]|uniref:MFS transporter n=1 Tax=Mammaliicoccus sciuri TaxID=1296 RepID=UPI001E31869D|nr:MFS transporter [Mammaliicoccus sciuri]MCD8884675.1 MFS transporter [Mammaliicoccus sciuri]MDU0268236.1 MFS transporter [Mammaliicoccus sciuri]MEB8142332.1 MFS transporter [Mammaliicoccus sciuri]WQL92567.1 MFS transporter [Mammaliicoccus sciuri]
MRALLKHTDFMQLIFGRILTNTADSIYFITTMWLIYDITKSSALTGLLSSLILVPKCLQMFYGPIIDHFSLKKILIHSQTVQAVLVGIIAILLFFHYENAILIIILVVTAAMVGEISYPISNKLVPVLLPKDKIVSGNAMMSFSNQSMDLVLNTVITILISLVSIYTLYVMNTIIFISAAVIYAMIKVQSQKSTDSTLDFKTYIKSLSEGLYTVRHSLLWIFQICAFAVNFGIGVVYTALPVLSHYLNQPIYYGLFLSAISLGMVLSTLVVGYVKKYPFGKLMVVTFILSGVFLLLGFVTPIYIFIILFGLSWLSVGLANILFLSAGQAIIPEYILGRITSITSSLGVIGLPLGSLIGGFLLELMNPIALISITGCFFIVLGIIWLVHPKLNKLRPIDLLTLDDFEISVDNKNIDIKNDALGS